MTRAADLDARTGLLDAIAAAVREKTEVELRLRAQLVELWESTEVRDRRFVPDELAIVLAESSRTTQNWVDSALLATCYPEVQALVDSGVWSTRHADAVLGELGGLTREQRSRVLELVLSQRGARTPHELRKATRAAVYVVDPEAAEKAAEKARTDRSVSVLTLSDGSASLLANGPKSAVALAMASLDALAVKSGPEDERSLDQRRFDTFMLLMTGQLTAAGAHVQLLVSLATLQGSDQPAEVPGFGFVTADEARALVEHAESVRRIVTDAEGQLVSVDSLVDRAPVMEPEQVMLLSDELEPDPVTEDEHTVPEAQWVAEAEDAVCDPEVARRRDAQELYDFGHPCPGPVEAPEEQAAQAQLRALLAVLQEQESATGRRVGDAHVRIEPDGTMRVHYRDDPHDPDPGPDGGPGPPDGPTQPLPAGYVDDRLAQRHEQESAAGPDPEVARQRWLRRTIPSWGARVPVWDPPPTPARTPSQGDLDWFEAHPDTAMAHALIEDQVPLTPLAAAPQTGWPTVPAARKAWDDERLGAVVSKLLRRPVTPLPPDSSRYPFTGPLARHLKTRDQTCRFPGCPRLAQHCDCDHRVPWPFGPTSVVNGVSECEHHHQCKHAIMTLTDQGHGTLRWTLPTGHFADSPARPLLRGW